MEAIKLDHSEILEYQKNRFPYLMIGTLKEKHYRNLGYNFKYIFSELDNTVNDSYYTSLLARITFYIKPILTIGFNRNILLPVESNGKKFSRIDAANIFFYDLSILKSSYQTLIAYFVLDFPDSGLKIFFELGTTDKWKDFNDYVNYPDLGIGSIIGIRQYGPFGNNNLVMGFEYARLAQSSFWDKRPTLNWYSNPVFDFSSYNGRRWAAHSGSDSDDLYIYFGYHTNKWSLIPSLNYERHGILFARPAEVKMEIKLDFRYSWNNYYFNILYEREWVEHEGFIPDKWRTGNVIWFGIERDITNLFKNKLGLVKSG